MSNKLDNLISELENYEKTDVLLTQNDLNKVVNVLRQQKEYTDNLEQTMNNFIERLRRVIAIPMDRDSVFIDRIE